jgi:hypothetical protein
MNTHLKKQGTVESANRLRGFAAGESCGGSAVEGAGGEAGGTTGGATAPSDSAPSSSLPLPPVMRITEWPLGASLTMLVPRCFSCREREREITHGDIKINGTYHVNAAGSVSALCDHHLVHGVPSYTLYVRRMASERQGVPTLGS